MSDLVKRLRGAVGDCQDVYVPVEADDVLAAAAEIERLQAELADSVAAEANAAYCSRLAYEAAERAEAERDTLRGLLAEIRAEAYAADLGFNMCCRIDAALAKGAG